MHHVPWSAVEHLRKSGDDSSSPQRNTFKAGLQDCMVLEESSSSVLGEQASGANAALNQNNSGIAHAHAETVLSSSVVPAATSELLKAANMWSQGTELHGTDNCNPCCYVHMPKGCKQGLACNFCHAPHTSMAQSRPGKNRRQQCKLLVDVAQELRRPMEPKFFCNHSPYMQSLLNAAKIGDKTPPRQKRLITL